MRWNYKVEHSCHSGVTRLHIPISCSLLGPSSVELDFIHRPHGSLHILQTYEAFVEAQIVPDSILED